MSRSFAELVEQLAPASAVLSSNTIEASAKLQVVRDVCTIKAARVSCRVAGARRLLTVYASDFTPTLHELPTAMTSGN